MEKLNENSLSGTKNFSPAHWLTGTKFRYFHLLFLDIHLPIVCFACEKQKKNRLAKLRTEQNETRTSFGEWTSWKLVVLNFSSFGKFTIREVLFFFSKCLIRIIVE